MFLLSMLWRAAESFVSIVDVHDTETSIRG